MKKIPTAFKRVFEGHKIIDILPEYTNEECKNAFVNGIATLKVDGSCCAVMGGMLYKRYDYKIGKNLPDNAIPCQENPDETTGHFPHWARCSRDNPADKWFFDAYDFYWKNHRVIDGTYEAVGPHFNGNNEELARDTLYKHGSIVLDIGLRNFDSCRAFLELHKIEGVVFWFDGQPVCKIKRSDFGFEWGRRK